MFKYTVDVDGMMCGMCESHTNSAVRRDFPTVKKVTSSHAKKQTVIMVENEIDENKLRETITGLGYDVGRIQKETCKNKGLFGFFHK